MRARLILGILAAACAAAPETVPGTAPEPPVASPPVAAKESAPAPAPVLPPAGAEPPSAPAPVSPPVVAPAPVPAGPPTVFEAKPIPRPPRMNGLGTMDYPPTGAEKPFLEKSAPKGSLAPAAFQSMEAGAGAYVGWFGIVRGVLVLPERDETRVYLEAKYFDGLTDTHILCMDFNGGGDFLAVLRGTEHAVVPLALLHVYGTVELPSEGPARVRTDYARQFDWGQFTFMFAQGKQEGSERWRKLGKPATQADGAMYDPSPDRGYFIDRLGPRSSYLTERPEIPQD